MSEKLHKTFRKKAINSSFFVIFFSCISFAGFFLRDYVMAKIYGFGWQLDIFYLATMIPMFMVTVFCIPFGQSVVPMLKKIQTLHRNQFYQKVRNLAFLISFICFFLCITTYIFSDLIFYVLDYFSFKEHSKDVKLMQIAFLPILLFSGLVIFGNTILSFYERYVYPSLFQIIVPLSSIIFLLIFGKFLGLYAVILGMILGQFINLVMVNNVLKHQGISLLPLKNKKGIFNDLPNLNNYSNLVFIAFFATILTPVNNLIASTLGDGSISLYNLGSKLSFFVMGILSILFTTILLPYLAKLANYKNTKFLKDETFYILVASTLLSSLFSILIFIYAESISRFLFIYIAIENATILGLASVIKYSFIQLPFWIFNTIIFKHATAISKTKIILYTSIFALILDITLAINITNFIHIGGLALSSTISFAFSAIIILIYYVFKKHLSFLQASLITLIWFIFGATLIGMNVNALLSLIEKLI